MKTKISMTCGYKEYEVKNGTGAITTIKIKFSQGYNMKIVISWGGWAFDGGRELKI